MNLLLISPHKEWWYKNGLPKSKDKIANANHIDRNVVFSTQNAISQHENLVKTLDTIPWITTFVHEYPNELMKVLKWKERALDKDTKYPRKYVFDNAVFTRDSFISNQKDKILLSNFLKEQRIEFESKIANELLSSLELQREIIIWPEDVNVKYEWGDFRYIPENNILIAWSNKDSSKSSRTTKVWVEFVSSQFWVPSENLLVIHSKSFHVDCVVSAVTNDYWSLIWMIVVSQDIHNISDVEKFCKMKKLFLYDIWIEYWNDSKWSIYAWAINTLNHNEYLLGKSLFNDEIEKKLDEYWVKRILSDTSEFRKASWSVHCLTNQI